MRALLPESLLPASQMLMLRFLTSVGNIAALHVKPY
jgi:hypothetical protein